MRKCEQAVINTAILNEIGDYIGHTQKYGPYRAERVNKCKAYIRYYPDYVVLISYATIVAIYKPSTGVLYDILRMTHGYTPTSAQHIAKFRKLMNVDNVLTWRPVIEKGC